MPRASQRSTHVSARELRAEGVTEIGRVASAAVAFVVTSRRVCLFHVNSIETADPCTSKFFYERTAELRANGFHIPEIAEILRINRKDVVEIFRRTKATA